MHKALLSFSLNKSEKKNMEGLSNFAVWNSRKMGEDKELVSARKAA